MKTCFRNGLLVLMGFLLVFAFVGCDNGSGTPTPVLEPVPSFKVNEIVGTWQDAHTTLVISDTEINFGLYKAEIVGVDNNGWNGKESSQATGDFGYAVIRYTQAPSWNLSIQDKFMIFRWQKLDSTGPKTTMSYSEGSNYPTNTYYDTAIEAVNGATGGSGFFNFFTDGIEKQ